MTPNTQHWIKRLNESNKPAYLLIADLIEEDISNERLRPRDQLPTLRDLSQKLGLNYTTVSRAYNEAKRRGLVDSQAGSGTYIKGKAPTIKLRDGSSAAMTMNMPPEPAGVAQRITEDAAYIISNTNLYDLMRYQDFGGSIEDRGVASNWLSSFVPNCTPDKVLVCPGIHSILLALMTHLARPGETICVEDLVYPGIKAIAAQLNITLLSIPSDKDGPIVSALEDACKTRRVKGFYCNPTIQNPSVMTITKNRRESIADIALRYNLPIIEDDAYGMLPTEGQKTIASLAPEVTWYISGFSKCFGAGLRSAFVIAPSTKQALRLAGSLRATSVMASPISNTLVTNWIKNGIVTDMLKAVRAESAARVKLASKILDSWQLTSHPEGFHIWLPISNTTGWSASELALHLRSQGISVVASSAFSTDNNPPEAVRICLGGPINREECEQGLKTISDTLEYPQHMQMQVM
ncbi:PLP-dependent aminotransferase family protein [Methylotenera sp.]|uniref:aminotransferase-like domain-containing protein n=1 Tax=Methylotenera sp. TaxID=2051956 RepID=UPI0027367F8A|nr:PLP-dependent aminotransferase family protein [Methylotenera sp.]MDP3777661.1 PLP-dependent aminotransferase family protein [Methylotenera sp.]